MTRIKSIIAFVIVLGLAWSSMKMPWIMDYGYYETGADLEATFVLIPFALIVMLSLIGLIENKVVNIIVDILCIIISVLVIVFFGLLLINALDGMGGNYWQFIGSGIKLIVAASLLAMIISIMSLNSSIKYGKVKTKKVTINNAANCNVVETTNSEVKTEINVEEVKVEDVVADIVEEVKVKVEEVTVEQLNILFCVECGTKFDDKQVFCAKCGKKRQC